jgi:aminopeptidase N
VPQPGASSFVEIRAEGLVKAVLNGAVLDSTRYDAGRLHLDDLAASNDLIVEAELPYVDTDNGMHRYADPVDDETYIGAYVGVDNAQRVFANYRRALRVQSTWR